MRAAPRARTARSLSRHWLLEVVRPGCTAPDGRTRRLACPVVVDPCGVGWPGCPVGAHAAPFEFLATFWRRESLNLAWLSQISPYRVGLRNRRSEVRILSGALENP